jgi:hypothetical protein
MKKKYESENKEKCSWHIWHIQNIFRIFTLSLPSGTLLTFQDLIAIEMCDDKSRKKEKEEKNFNFFEDAIKWEKLVFFSACASQHSEQKTKQWKSQV